MGSKAEEVEERIADLSELIAAARRVVAELGEDDLPDLEFRRANLQATIVAVERELILAKQSLQGARGQDAAAEILTKVKAQALEGQSMAQFHRTRSHARRVLDHAIPSESAEAILLAANTKVKKRKARAPRLVRTAPKLKPDR